MIAGGQTQQDSRPSIFTPSSGIPWQYMRKRAQDSNSYPPVIRLNLNKVIILHNARLQECEIPTARHRVLLVEDCRDSAELVKALLKGSEIELTILVDGNRGLEVFKSATYNLVLMDIKLPVLDGCAATLTIRHWEIQNSRAFTTVTALTAV